MRSICLHQYGSLESFKLTELPKPEPRAGEIRLRVHMSALNPADFKVALGLFKFLHARNFPMALGYDFSGVVDAVGPNLSAHGGAGSTRSGAAAAGISLKPGDEVFGFLPYGPFNKQGAFSEFIITKANQVAMKPSNVTHAQAAAGATSAITALQGIRDVGKLSTKNGRVLVSGVSGGVGSTAIIVAKKLGAQVCAVGSGGGLQVAKRFGADQIIDRKSTDVLSSVGEPFDVVFDAAAAFNWLSWKSKIKKGGVFVTTLPSLGFARDKILSIASSSGVGFVNVKSIGADLTEWAQWMTAGAGAQIEINSTIPVRDVARGLAKVHRGEVLGRIAVDVINGF